MSSPSPALSRPLAVVVLLALLAAAVPQPVGGLPPQDASLLPAAINEKEVVTDPAEDVTFTILGAGPAPPNDMDAAVDILSLKIAETGDALRFSLAHRAYPDLPATLSDLVLFQQMDCNIDFQRGGYDDVTWSVDIFGEHVLDGGPYTFFANANFVEEGDEFRFEYLDELEVSLVGGDHVEVVFPKALFEEFDDDDPLAVGDTLEGFNVYCEKWLTFLVWFQDDAESAPGAAGEYEVSVSGLGTEVTLEFPAGEDGYLPPLSVAVTHASKTGVVVTNLLERRVLVNLTASITDTTGAALAGWKVQTAPTLELAAGKSITASIVITAPLDAPHRSGGLLTVRAFAIGYEETVTLTRPVHATVSPSVERNTLYFHNDPVDAQFCPGICDDTLPRLFDPVYDGFVLNVLDEDPDYDEAEGEDDGIALLSDDDAIARLDAPLADPIRFNPDGLFELTVGLRSAVPRDVEMEMFLLGDYGELYLGGAVETLSLGTNTEAFVIPFGLRGDVAQLEPDSTLELRMRFSETSAGGIRLTQGAWIASVEWAPSLSKLVLPLVPVPQTVFNITDGRALPTVALTNTTDAERFINPGEPQAFDLLLINEGTQTDVLALRAEPSLPGWGYRFEPGNRFELDAGTSAPLCLSLTAPADAVEGQIILVNLSATSEIDPLVRTTAQLRAIVTGLPQVAGVCSIDEDSYVAPVKDKSRGSPGPAFLVAVAGLVGLLAVLRRRGQV